MDALECQLFIEGKNEEIECLAVTPNGYFCAVAQKQRSITIFDTITFHSWLKISTSEQYSLRSLFFLKKASLNSEFQKFRQHDDLFLQSENLSEVDSDCSDTTACTSPTKSPFREPYHSVPDGHIDTFELYKYRLIGLGLDGRIVEWDLSTGTTIGSAFSYGGAIFQGSLSPSGESLALACADGSIKIFSLLNDELLFMYSLPKHSNRLLSITYLTDDRIFAGSSDGTILEYNLETRLCTNRMSVSTGNKLANKHSSKDVSVWCLACIESDNVLFSGDSNGTVIVWDLVTYTAINTFRHHVGEVITLSKLGDVKTKTTDITIVSTGIDGRVVTYINDGGFDGPEQPGKWLPGSFSYPHSCIGSVAAIKLPQVNGPLALSGSWDGKLMLWLPFENNIKRRKSGSDFLSTSPRFKYLNLPVGVLKSPPNIHLAESERLILFQSLKTLELWFISDPDLSNGTETSPDKISINPLQLTYKKLNNLYYSNIIESDKKISNLIPVQPIKLLDIKLSKKKEVIYSSALSTDGSYILGSFSESGIKSMHIDLQNLSISNAQLESCSNIVATCMKFLTNTTVIIGGYMNIDVNVSSCINSNIYIVDIERDIIVSKLDLEHLSKSGNSGIGKITSFEVSPDNQWLAVLTSFGGAFVVDMDSFKLEVDLTNFESDILNHFSNNNYFAPVASVCFNNRDNDIVSVMMSDGKYYFYSISLKKIIPLEYIRNHNDYSDNSPDSYRLPREIYSPILHGPILDISWVVTVNQDPKLNQSDVKDIMIIRTNDYTDHFILNRNEKSNEQKNSNVNPSHDSVHMEKGICGPVSKLPRFKRVDTFTNYYNFFPERSLEFSDLFNSKPRPLQDSRFNTDFSRSNSYDHCFKNKQVYGVFWTNSPKWITLFKKGIDLKQRIQEYQFNGCLVVLSCKSCTKMSNGDKYGSTLNRRYGN
ncbi:WD40 repeat-containing protein [Cryptosporidium canis]|uniref:WD40 repeat-containing protein n=1 Tax=Cryptosporidium canis TaxID=195482 RepID=A0A9D5DJ39_9CRYT|nr:WD40 repeat-containing protein [Cryptosporidium canis]